jgi:hypothetical protein
MDHAILHGKPFGIPLFLIESRKTYDVMYNLNGTTSATYN